MNNTDSLTQSAAPTATTPPLSAAEIRSLSETHPVLFFDGVCGLCNFYVDFVLLRDTAGLFRFAPLQGSTAEQVISEEDRARLDSLVLMQRGRVFRKSAAVARVLCRLSPLWAAAGTLLWLIPLPLRDLGYTLVAKNRYRLFGRKESCRLPQPAERARFLD